jgi:hypothetical protein
MMSFINTRVVAASASLKAAHFPFPRGEKLFEAMSWCVTDYYSKATSGRPLVSSSVKCNTVDGYGIRLSSNRKRCCHVRICSSHSR